MCPVLDVPTLPNMQGYPYDIWTIKFWTVKFPGDIWIVEIWTVKTGLGIRLLLGLRLVMTVQFMTAQVLTVQLRHVTKEQQPPLLAHVYCRQTAEWINMPFGMDIVLDGNPALP